MCEWEDKNLHVFYTCVQVIEYIGYICMCMKVSARGRRSMRECVCV